MARWPGGRIAACLAAALSLTTASAFAAGRLADASATTARATSTYGALQRFFYEPSSHGYAAEYAQYGQPSDAQVWPFSQALWATLGLAELPGAAGPAHRDAVLDRLVGLQRYWDTAAPGVPGYAATATTPPGKHRRVPYYDDNDWIGLDLAEAYEVTGDPAALQQSEAALRFVLSGWDTDTSHACHGGVFWTTLPDDRDRTTVSTAPGAELAARLYLLTGNRDDLAWAKRLYGWVRTCLGQGPLYADHVSLAGRVDPTVWSYNQGSMIGAGVLLWRATGDRTYLAQARATAAAAVGAYAQDAARDRVYLAAILFDRLLLLDHVEHSDRYLSFVEQYAMHAWATERNQQTGLFHLVRPRLVQLLEQAAMTRVYADLAGAGTPLPPARAR